MRTVGLEGSNFYGIGGVKGRISGQKASAGHVSRGVTVQMFTSALKLRQDAQLRLRTETW